MKFREILFQLSHGQSWVTDGQTDEQTYGRTDGKSDDNTPPAGVAEAERGKNCPKSGKVSFVTGGGVTAIPN